MLARRHSQAVIPPKCKQFKYKPSRRASKKSRLSAVSSKSYQAVVRRRAHKHQLEELNKLESVGESSRLRRAPVARGKNLRRNMKSRWAAELLLVSLLLARLATGSGLEASSRDTRTAVTSKPRMPYFAELPDGADRHTAVAGRSVRFECVVMDLGSRHVAWMHKRAAVPLLAIDNETKSVTKRDRIKASVQGNSIFSLEIKKVELKDEGEYSCQILNLQANMRMVQHHFLEVLQSPQIRENESTIKIKPVEEGKPVEMRCVAYGVPKPVIKWRRQSRVHELTPTPPDEDEEELAVLSADSELHNNQLESQQTNSTERPQMAPHARHLRQHANHFTPTQHSRQRRAPGVAPLWPSGNRGWLFGPARERRSSTAAQDDSEAPASGAHSLDATNLQTDSLETAGEQTLASTTSSLRPPATPALIRALVAEGEVYRIERVSRYDSGFYECIASNGVHPAVSQRIFLPVNWQKKGSGINARNSSGGGTGTLITSPATSGASATSTAFRIGNSNGVGLLATTAGKLDETQDNRLTAMAADGGGGGGGGGGATSGARTVSVGSGRAGGGFHQRARYRQNKAARSSASAGSSATPTLLSGCTASLAIRVATWLAWLWCAWLAAADADTQLAA